MDKQYAYRSISMCSVEGVAKLTEQQLFLGDEAKGDVLTEFYMTFNWLFF